MFEAEFVPSCTPVSNLSSMFLFQISPSGRYLPRQVFVTFVICSCASIVAVLDRNVVCLTFASGTERENSLIQHRSVISYESNKPSIKCCLGKFLIQCLARSPKSRVSDNQKKSEPLVSLSLINDGFFAMMIMIVSSGDLYRILHSLTRVFLSVARSVSKGCVAASIVFLLERKGLIQAPHAVIYFGVALFFIYFRLSSVLLGIHDPFLPFENLFCAVFMGGMWDAMKRAVSGKTAETQATDNNPNNTAKSKDDKKRD